MSEKLIQLYSNWYSFAHFLWNSNDLSLNPNIVWENKILLENENVYVIDMICMKKFYE